MGSACVGMAFIGLLLPILPTTPFLLLAAFFYARSSQKFYIWLIHNRWFGTYLRNYREGRGMRLRDKLITLNLLWLTIGATIHFTSLPFVLDLLIFVVPVGVSTHILSIPTAPQADTQSYPEGILSGENDPAA